MSGSKIVASPILKKIGLCFLGVKNMIYMPGYVYHIKDEFFEKVQDDKLMKNKEGGTYRPTYYCVKDEKTSLLWVVPMSTRYEKYEAIYNKKVQKYGKCITIVLGEFDGKKSVFLLQNMFPITEYYLDHLHTKKGNPVPVHTDIQKIIKSNMQAIMRLISRNKFIVFPDVKRIERIIMSEEAAHKQDCAPEKTPFNDLLVQRTHDKTKDSEKANERNNDPER